MANGITWLATQAAKVANTSNNSSMLDMFEMFLLGLLSLALAMPKRTGSCDAVEADARSC